VKFAGAAQHMTAHGELRRDEGLMLYPGLLFNVSCTHQSCCVSLKAVLLREPYGSAANVPHHTSKLLCFIELHELASPTTTAAVLLPYWLAHAENALCLCIIHLSCCHSCHRNC
jgi:hypothetical protein